MNGSLYRTCCCPLSSVTGNHHTSMYNQVFGLYVKYTQCCLDSNCVSHQLWNWKVPFSSTLEIIFPLNLESGTFAIQALMSFYPLRLSPIIINIPHSASGKKIAEKKKIHRRSISAWDLTSKVAFLFKFLIIVRIVSRINCEYKRWDFINEKMWSGTAKLGFY